MFKKVVSCFEKKRILHIFHFLYPKLLMGINLKRCCGNSFVEFIKKEVVFINNGAEEAPDLVSLFRCLSVLLLMQGMYYVVSAPIYDEKLHYKFDRK